MTIDDSSDKSGDAPLDLGIAGLLREGVSGPAPIDPSSAGPFATGAGALPSTPVAFPAEEAQDEFSTLAAEGRWKELIQLAEGRFSGDTLHPATLWWVKGHIEAQSLPPVMLVGSLLKSARVALQGTSARLVSLSRELVLAMLKREAELNNADLFEVREVARSLNVTVTAPSTLQGGLVQTPRMKDAPVLPLPDRRRGGNLRIRRALVVLSALIAAGCLLFYVNQPTLELLPAQVAARFVSTAPDPRLPAREPIRGSTLGALYYEIAQSPTADRSARQPDPPPVKAVPIRQERSAPPAPPPLPRRKQRVDTAGPLEPPNIRSSDRDDAAPPREDARPIDGVSRDISPASGTGIRRVIARTSVLDDPNYRARVVGQLEVGDRVYVEARVGRWLRLRSKRGRGGFVLAEDVDDPRDDDFRQQ